MEWIFVALRKKLEKRDLEKPWAKMAVAEAEPTRRLSGMSLNVIKYHFADSGEWSFRESTRGFW